MNKIEVKYSNKSFLIDKINFQSLNSKGYGKKEGDIYTLDYYEALYLLEKGNILVLENNTNNKLSFEKIITKIKIDIKNYLIYKDLRTKGYIVKSGLKYGFTFRVYDKGIKLKEDHSLWLVEGVFEKDKILIKDLTGKNRTAHSAKKKMILAIVDLENGITYLENNWKRL